MGRLRRTKVWRIGRGDKSLLRWRDGAVHGVFRATSVIDPNSKPAFGPAVPRDLCTDCCSSRTEDPKRCGRACQFIAPDYPAPKAQLVGPSELHFGPFRRMVRVALSPASADAQWTGITTRTAERLLEMGAVDAVLTIAPDPDDKWRPVPALVTKAEAMAACRGMRMGYSPLLLLLEPAQAAGHKRLAVIGIHCQVHALRRLEAELGFERLYVVGTPCSHDTTTERFHEFLALSADDPDTITDLEFRTAHLPCVRRRHQCAC